jgi:hypothetical protein
MNPVFFLTSGALREAITDYLRKKEGRDFVINEIDPPLQDNDLIRVDATRRETPDLPAQVAPPAEEESLLKFGPPLETKNFLDSLYPGDNEKKLRRLIASQKMSILGIDVLLKPSAPKTSVGHTIIEEIEKSLPEPLNSIDLELTDNSLAEPSAEADEASEEGSGWTHITDA